MGRVNDKKYQRRYTDRARHAIDLAEAEADRLHHHYIGTEHILLGLIREGNGIAAGVLESMGVDLKKARTAVEFILGSGSYPQKKKP